MQSVCLQEFMHVSENHIIYINIYIIQSIKIPLFLAAMCKWGVGTSSSTSTFWTASKSLLT